MDSVAALRKCRQDWWGRYERARDSPDALNVLTTENTILRAHHMLNRLYCCLVRGGGTLVIERALVLFAKLNWQLGKPEDANKAFNMLKSGFPKSQFIKEVDKVLRRPQGEVFAPPAKGPAPLEPGKAAQKADAALGVMSEVVEIAMEPFFIFAWLATQVAIYFIAKLGLWPDFLRGDFFGMVDVDIEPQRMILFHHLAKFGGDAHG